VAEHSGQERTEQPTPKRLREAREKGQVPRSRELNTTLMMLGAALGLLALGPFMAERAVALWRRAFALERGTLFDPAQMAARLSDDFLTAMGMIAPFLLLMLVVSFLGPGALGGLQFNPKSLGLKWDKLDPLKGLKRLFGQQGLVELGKALAKFLLLGAVSVAVFLHLRDRFLGLAAEPLGPAVAHGLRLLLWEFLALAASLLLIAAIDVPYQLWQHRRQLRMTRQEVKDEMKETDGNPEIKGKLRSLQREIAQRRMLEAVPSADVVVVNPTHFAVALRYEEGTDRAPRVVAKGADQLALKIREIAQANDVPVFSAPPLARALYFSTEVDQPIPTALYQAVARILAYLFQLRQAQTYGAPPPERPRETDLPVPDELAALDRRNTRFER